MTIKSYSDLNSLELDTLREIGSIGTGNAATALSSLIGQQVRIEMPEVRIMGYNEAIEWIGGPEEITAGVLVKMSGQVNGIMLSVQQLKFVNLVLESMLGKGVEDYSGLHEMECSALIEVVPAFTVDMQGAIMAVPMAEYGGQSDYIMTIGGNFVRDGQTVPCRLLLSPDIRSLNFLLRKLGVSGGA